MSLNLESSKTTSYITDEDASTLMSNSFTTECLEVVNYCVSPYNSEKLGHLGDHMLLTIQVQKETDSCESINRYTFFAKCLAPQASAFNVHVFQEESHFYGKFLPLLHKFDIDPWAPQCYLVKKNAIVLEDLKSQGFNVAAGHLSMQQLKASIEALARFHGSSMLLEYQLKVPLKDIFTGVFEEKLFKNDNGFNRKFLNAGMEVAESIACDLGLDPKFVVLAYENMMQDNNFEDNKWNVLCHQDLWVNNMVFSKDDKSCRLVDFQMVAYGSFVTDILQLLYLNLNMESRPKLERSFFQFYHLVLQETLISNGIPNDEIVSLEKMLEIIEKKRIYGLFSALHMGPVVYLNKHFNNEYTKDRNIHMQYCYGSRKDFVKKVMQSDQYYRQRLEESVREIVNYMEKNSL